ncbi:transglutaminase-like cysteine peptidase [Mesorhizobium sp. VK25A]|uniref:Transglutaminase-like cysteine peptidase n=1 Tax=Mesorhizobium vachelliae TaxID=3072309 RepID=A0ABU5A1E8_9HYPH|nr:MULTISPECIES: transglutaminase-like cysteine peptidase [unclassified Mesorhizobium]MDX8531052.1 transglutaminase-like cysteine peptidase [Mesorhizobium sp. VK25D]MDX8543197.1 transglutaminase-like cysteine peptidase [Mesorhizobium sp. VK25A]
MMLRRLVAPVLSTFLGLVSLANAGSVGPQAAAASFTYPASFKSYAIAFKAAQPASSPVGSATAATVGASTSIPYGWMDFCGRRPEECQVAALPAVNLKLTPRTWSILNQVNREVNGYIVPESNLDHWGTTMDHWDYPVDGKGDCKIYALFKRKLLLDAGLPRQALLMTVVYDLHGEGHAILTVKTDRGDFILDNLVDNIRSWDATGYYFLKRQSQQNPNVWVSINLRGDAALKSAKQLHANN